MKIENEIKLTTPFTNEYQKAAINILFTASWINTHHTKVLKGYDLTPQQFNLLRILRGQHPKPATVNLLIERMLDKSSNVSRLVDRLSNKGLVERCTNESDKRSVDVIISEKGLDVLKSIDTKAETLEENLQTLSIPEAQQLNELLDKMRG